MIATGKPLGFLRVSRARTAQRAIGKSEHIVTVLHRAPANLTPAEEALHIAKELYAASEYSQAIEHARRAKTLATSLNERFNAYTGAWNALLARMEELKRLGLKAGALETVLGEAEGKVVAGVEENGAVVPNYLEATEMLERAAEEGHRILVRANQASNGIFLATLAVEAFTELQRPRAQGWTAVHLEHMIERATRELALGDIDSALRISSEVEARAERARAALLKARDLLDQAGRSLAEPSAKGAAVGELAARIAATHESLATGRIDPATGVTIACRLSREAGNLAANYGTAREVLDEAERVYKRLGREGFHSYEVDASLEQARRALASGDFAGVKENVAWASQAFVRRRSERGALARGISDLETRLADVRGRSIPLLPDIQEILGRAEAEFRAGSFAGAREDLLIATVLLSQAANAGA